MLRRNLDLGSPFKVSRRARGGPFSGVVGGGGGGIGFQQTKGKLKMEGIMEEDITEEQQRWFEYFMPRAERGDAQAQLAVGIGYANGKMVPKDLQKAELWLRLAANKMGERAVFHLMKILSREQSPRTKEVFEEKAEWNLGAIYLIYGRFVLRSGDTKLGRLYLKKGWEKGSIIAGISFFASKYRKPWKIVTLPIVLPLIVKAAIIKVRNKDDPRVLE